MRKLSATSKAGRQKNDLWGPSGTPLSVLRAKLLYMNYFISIELIKSNLNICK